MIVDDARRFTLVDEKGLEVQVELIGKVGYNWQTGKVYYKFGSSEDTWRVVRLPGANSKFVARWWFGRLSPSDSGFVGGPELNIDRGHACQLQGHDLAGAYIVQNGISSGIAGQQESLGYQVYASSLSTRKVFIFCSSCKFSALSTCKIIQA